MFGSSDHVEKPDKPDVIANYWRCHTDVHLKSITQPKYTKEIKNSHFPEFHEGAVRVNMLREPMIGSKTTSVGEHGALAKTPDNKVYDLMYISHYATRYANRFIYVKFSGYKKLEGYNSSDKDHFGWGIGMRNITKIKQKDEKDHDCTVLQMPTTYLPKAPSSQKKVRHENNTTEE
jgi:hypothetical protein